MFTHHVFFWLNNDLSQQDIEKFETGVKSLLPITSVSSGDVGKPASTDRPVIERGYSYSLLLQFADMESHDAYQVDPIHETFIHTCAHLWSKVLIFDTESI